jgi:hypothetical protein
VYGLTFINIHMRRALNTLTPWATFERVTQAKLDDGIIAEVSDESATPSSGEATPAGMEEAIIEQTIPEETSPGENIPEEAVHDD